jgi:hypothetical protein
MDESASRELWQHLRANVVVINPAAATAPAAAVDLASAAS